MLVLAAAAMALLGSLRQVDSLRASAPSSHRNLTDVISSVRATPVTALRLTFCPPRSPELAITFDHVGQLPFGQPCLADELAQHRQRRRLLRVDGDHVRRSARPGTCRRRRRRSRRGPPDVRQFLLGLFGRHLLAARLTLSPPRPPACCPRRSVRRVTGAIPAVGRERFRTAATNSRESWRGPASPGILGRR